MPGFDLRDERTIVAVRLVELLRRRRLLREQASRALVVSLRHVPLRLEHVEVLRGFLDARAARGLFRRRFP